MKCPKCAASTARKTGLVCSGCKYAFVFDPKADGISDGKFLGLIKAASASDRRYFTFSQLYAVYCRGRVRQIAALVRRYLTPVGIAGAISCALCVAALVVGVSAENATLTAAGALLVPVSLTLVAVGIGSRRTAEPYRVAADKDKLQGWVAKWQRTAGPIGKLIERPSLHEPPPTFSEADLFDYGVERIVLVERDILVDLLVRNGVHAAQRALVISESGYPHYLVHIVRRLVDQRPDLPVVLLHDATPAGLAMRERLAHAGPFPLAGRRVIDAGITPEQARGVRALDVTVPEASGYGVPLDLLLTGAIAGGLASIAAAPTMLPGEVPWEPRKKPDSSGASGGGGDSGSTSFGDSGDDGGDFG